ncbi:MAG: Na+/H+ antiporter subunit D [Ignavibacteriales bacterium]|nr:Na+/H+ antiporter subunit D [Ignavibacteriales bacterium]MCF8317010.1 Na+/H+ antiporter subunit D [Ignavibacteriales bacterium]MCF8438608.1 Na+/H+ antiporter subunit D [Ignavibacteriales bacterium]
MILIVLPILLPFLTALLLIFIRSSQLSKYISLSGSFAQLLAGIYLVLSVYNSGIISLQAGSWEAPFGITIVADLLSAGMVLISGLIAFTGSIYSIPLIDNNRIEYRYYPLYQFLFMGINGAFLTGDIFNLYVWYEVMLISSFVLLSLGGTKDQLEGSIKYVTLNLLSSAFFLAAIGILYGISGTLNMADLSVKLHGVSDNPLVFITGILFFIAFGIKSAVFPLFFWLPASYHTPPAPVSAVFAGMLTKVGIYSVFRVYTLIFNIEMYYLQEIFLVIACLTMFTGVMGAAAQNDIRRILSFHIVSQIGYMLLGLALNSTLAIAGGIFYIFHHIIVKTNLFYVGGIVNRIKGTYHLPKLGGIYRRYPYIALLFLIPAFSLAGIPPLSGFWAKFSVAKAGFDLNAYIPVAISLIVGLLTLFSMSKIWNEVFWKDQNESDSNNTHNHEFNPGEKMIIFLPTVILAIITITISLNPDIFFGYAKDAAAQLLDKKEYIQTVLGR